MVVDFNHSGQLEDGPGCREEILNLFHHGIPSALVALKYCNHITHKPCPSYSANGGNQQCDYRVC